MYLSKLKLSGFKSFAENVEVDFNSGLTCIVGPNGCGKSNIVDAIRWVLGEHNPREIRADTNEEIFFAGGDGNPPAGVVEVEVLFNEAGDFNPDKSDVLSIKRQLFRSSESKYFINGNRCRLKDIKDLFLDTGIGKVAYSIMVQGMVDKVLSDKPKDRREIFEEAVGITGYKESREETIRKLDKINDNLERINDILNEVKKQESKLRIQVEKVRNYRRLMEEMKTDEISLSGEKYQKFRDKLNSHNENYDELIFERDKKQSQLTIYEKEQSEVRKKITVDRIESDKLDSEIKKLEEEINKYEKELIILKENIKHTQEDIETKTDRINTIDNDSDEIKEEIKILEKEVQSTNEYNKKLRNVINNIKERIEVRRRNISSIEKFQNEVRDEVFKGELVIEDINNSLTEQIAERSRMEAEIESYDRELKMLITKQDEVESDIEEDNKKRKDLEDKIDRIEAEINETIEKLKDSETIQDGIDESIDNSLRELEKEKAKLTVLESSYRGLEEIPEILKVKTSEEESLIKRFADIFDVDEELKDGFASVISFYNDIFITKTIDKDLKKIAGNKVESSISLISYNNLNYLFHSKDNESFDATALSEYIRVEDDAGSDLMLLLNNIFVIDNWKKALQLMKENKLPGAGVVSRDGMYFHPSGIITLSGTEDRVLLRKRLKNEVEDLKQSIAKRDKHIGEKRDEYSKVEKETKALSNDVDNLKDEYKDIINTKELIDKGLKNLNEEYSRIKERKKMLDGVINSLNEELTEIVSNIQKYKDKIDLLKEEFKTGRDKTLDSGKRIDCEREWIDHYLDRLMKLNGKKSGIESKIENLNQRVKRNLDRIKDGDETVSRLTEEISNLKENLELYKEKIEKFQSILSNLRSSMGDLIKKFNELKGEREPSEKKMDELERKILKTSRDLQTIEEKIGTIKEKRSNISGKMEMILNDLHTKYEITEEELLKVELPDNFNHTEVKEKIKEFTKEIKSLGRINFTAEKEYEEIEERMNFLSKQYDDMISAKENLLSTIENLDERSREIFKEGIEEIDRSYGEVFKEFFNGGDAGVSVEEGTDILEGGIKVRCRPPDKRMGSIRLLSGGERALAALALIFAIQSIKPTPFSILDEVDATLDDSNTIKFIQYLHKYSEKQMILITHNRMTMKEADTLIGVTMEKPGISSLVPVNLRKFEEEFGESIKGK